MQLIYIKATRCLTTMLNLRRSPLMHGIVQQLSEKEMKALAAYLESL
jgi:cytochrome c553